MHLVVYLPSHIQPTLNWIIVNYDITAATVIMVQLSLRAFIIHSNISLFLIG